MERRGGGSAGRPPAVFGGQRRVIRGPWSPLPQPEAERTSWWASIRRLPSSMNGVDLLPLDTVASSILLSTSALKGFGATCVDQYLSYSQSDTDSFAGACFTFHKGRDQDSGKERSQPTEVRRSWKIALWMYWFIFRILLNKITKLIHLRLCRFWENYSLCSLI